MRITNVRNIGLLSLLIAGLTACGTTDSQAVFTSAAPRDTPNLAAPPGLTAPDVSTTYKMNKPSQTQTSGYQISNVKGMYIASGGSQRWLVLESDTVNNVWPLMMSYMNQLGLTVKYQNQSIGVIQSDWASRNTAVPQGSSLRGIFEWIGWGGMYSLNSMYMYRVTLWQDGNNVVIMDTNYQMDEEYQGCSSPGIANTSSYASSDQQQTKWIPRGSNPQLELEFLAQFMSFSGLPADEVKKVVATVKEPVKNAVVQNNQIIVNDTFDRTWWRTAIALDRVGLGIADKNRSNGEYDVYPLKASVENNDPGFMAKWFSNESATIGNEIKSVYAVKLSTNSNNQTVINFSMYNGVPEEQDFVQKRQKYLDGIANQLQ